MQKPELNRNNTENAEKRLLILGSLSEMTGLVQKARDRGIYTIVCDGYPDGPARQYADRTYTADVREIETIAGICRKERVDRIITSFSDLMFECMVKIADLAGLPCYVSPDMLPAYRDKETTKSICRKLGISVPAYLRLPNDFDEQAIPAAGISFPALVKPVDSYGSRGMHIVRSIQELRDCFSDSAQFSGDGSVLLETISRGQELNCQAFLADGELYLISIADRLTAPWREDTIPIDYANRYPSDHFDETAEAVCDVFRRYVSHTGQKWGPLAMQCFWDGREIQVCEITARYFGFEHELTDLSAGMDLEELLLDLAYDREAAKNRVDGYAAKGNRWAEVVYLTSVREGKVADQEEVEKLAYLPGVVYSQLFCRLGDRTGIRGPQPYYARYYIQADSREELVRTEREILERCRAVDETGTDLLFHPEL